MSIEDEGREYSLRYVKSIERVRYEGHVCNLGVEDHPSFQTAVNCDTWSRWKRAALFLRKNGDVFSSKDSAGKVKYVQQWPQVGIARNLLAVLHRTSRNSV